MGLVLVCQYNMNRKKKIFFLWKDEEEKNEITEKCLIQTKINSYIFIYWHVISNNDKSHV